MGHAADGEPRIVRVDLSLALPGARDERDTCVDRLRELVARVEGVEQVHVVVPQEGAGMAPPDGEHAEPIHGAAFCVHFDPAATSLEEIVLFAAGAGAAIATGVGVLRLPISQVAGREEIARADDELRRMPGVYRVRRVRPVGIDRGGVNVVVEYDVARTDVDALIARWRAGESG